MTDAALQNTLLSRKIERMHHEIEREMDRASKAEAEVVRLREELGTLTVLHTAATCSLRLAEAEPVQGGVK